MRHCVLAGVLLMTCVLLAPASAQADPGSTRHASSSAPAPGLWLAASDGGVFALGAAPFHGSLAGSHLDAPIVAIGSDDSGGYELAGADGGVFTFGDEKFYGSMAGAHLDAPIVGIVPSAPATWCEQRCLQSGYWLVGADGGVFTFGSAPFFGSLAGQHLDAPIVALVPSIVCNTSSICEATGYYLIGADGGVFTFGHVGFWGSLAGTHLDAPIVGAVLDQVCGENSCAAYGYTLVGQDGGVFTFSSPVPGLPPQFLGSLAGTRLNAPIVGVGLGEGYALFGADGGVFMFPDAWMSGSLANLRLQAPIVGGATTYVEP